MAERVDSPSATSGKGRDPGYVEVDAAGRPVGKAGELSDEQRDAVEAASALTATDQTPENQAKALDERREGETDPDGTVNDEEDREDTEASAIDVTSPSFEDVAVADEDEDE